MNTPQLPTPTVADPRGRLLGVDMKNYFVAMLVHLRNKLGSGRLLQIRNNLMNLVNEILTSPFEMNSMVVLYEGVNSSVFNAPNENCDEYEWLSTINFNMVGLLQSVVLYCICDE